MGALCCALVFVGGAVWLFLPVLKMDTAGVGGLVVKSGKEYTGLELVMGTITAGGWYVGVATFFMGIVAPFIQAFVPILSCFRGREDQDPLILDVFREIGDAFSVPDMLAGGFIASCVSFNGILLWGLQNVLQMNGMPAVEILDLIP